MFSNTTETGTKAMAIIQHNGAWYRVSAERVVANRPDEHVGWLPPDVQTPHKYQVGDEYLGVWERLGGGEFHVGDQPHNNERSAIEEAFKKVLAIAPSSA